MHMYLLINKASLSFMECEIIFWQNGIHKLPIEKWQHRREGDKNPAKMSAWFMETDNQLVKFLD